MTMSSPIKLINPLSNVTAGITIPSFIGYMKYVIEISKNNSTRRLIFLNAGILSKLTNYELIVLKVVIIG